MVKIGGLAVVWVLGTGTLWSQIQGNLITVVPSTSGATPGTLLFREASNSASAHTVGFSARPTIAANVVWKLPAADAVGCWQSDGAGNTSISPCGATTTSFSV